MIRRLWLVVSILWSVLVAGWGLIGYDPAETVGLIIAASIPWVIGPAIFYAVRFVLYGNGRQYGTLRRMS